MGWALTSCPGIRVQSSRQNRVGHTLEVACCFPHPVLSQSSPTVLSCRAFLWTPLSGVGKAGLLLGSGRYAPEARNLHLHENRLREKI